MNNKAIEINVYCQWDSSGFLLWGKEDSRSYWDPVELKLNLFTWHKDSFYGTLIPETGENGILGIRLSPALALDFFLHPPEPEFLSLRWDKEISRLHTLAPLIKEMLSNGSWVPDFEQWQKGDTCWKLLFPPGLQTGEMPLYLNEWVTCLINNLVENEPKVQKAWTQVAENYPLLHEDGPRTAGFIDEEDWLTAIGWKQDNTPFFTCLQLIEPDEDCPCWMLNILLKDKNDPDLLLEYSPQSLAGTEPYPGEWRPFMDKPEKVIQKWIYHLPWLQDREKTDRINSQLTEDQAWEFLTEGSLKLAETGFTVFLPEWWDELRKLKPKLRVKTRSSVGSAQQSFLGMQQLIQFDWKMAVGDMELSPEEFERFILGKKRLLKIRGRWIQLDPVFLQNVRQIMKKKKNGMSLGELLQIHFLSGVAAAASDVSTAAEDENIVPIEADLNEHLTKMVEQLTSVSSLPTENPPASFQGELRNYQRTGYSWLLFLRQFGLGGCLADDMGLGKTIQWIAYLLELKAREQTVTPSLLICPTSVIGNWQMEIKRFAPSLKVYVHYGPQRSKGENFSLAVGGLDLIITSYTLAHMDHEDLQSINWNSICLDEAQNIKNAYTKQAGAVRKLAGAHKIALTGTPMENRLTELWSIMDFLNPSYLGSLTAFNRQFVNTIEKTRDSAVIEQVQRLVRPFLLRRVKNDPAIELDLPDKQEVKEYITLTVEQASLYEHTIEETFKRLEQLRGMERRGLILATLTKLKQICNHPALILKETGRTPKRNRSAKLERLGEMVEELRREGDRCLIFTQFVEMGYLIEEFLRKELTEPIQFLHGGTPKIKRDAMIKRFQDQSLTGKESYGVFVLSLKAGGTGLNLTAANHVFHFDRWWNPAVENQATDRAYRIGQDRHVLVHKFITLGTLEERIDEMLEYKQGLNELIVGAGEKWITELSTGELRDIVALRREWIRTN